MACGHWRLLVNSQHLRGAQGLAFLGLFRVCASRRYAEALAWCLFLCSSGVDLLPHCDSTPRRDRAVLEKGGKKKKRTTLLIGLTLESKRRIFCLLGSIGSTFCDKGGGGGVERSTRKTTACHPTRFVRLLATTSEPLIPTNDCRRLLEAVSSDALGSAMGCHLSATPLARLAIHLLELRIPQALARRTDKRGKKHGDNPTATACSSCSH